MNHFNEGNKLYTEKQFQKMELVVGEEHKDVIDNDERLIIL